MTAAVLDRPTIAATRPACPDWCTNYRHPRAAEIDICSAGSRDRQHWGRFGAVVVPSAVDSYYDQEIGVELYRYDNGDGTVHQLSVALTYSREREEIGHVTLGIADARRLVEVSRFSWIHASRDRQATFGGDSGPNDGNTITVCGPSGTTRTHVLLSVEGRRVQLPLRGARLRALGSLIAEACNQADTDPAMRGQR